MTYAPQRSLSLELDQGLIDGSARQVVQNRGGVVEYTTAASRRHLSDTYYGMHEDNEKVDPFGRIVYTPYYTPTRPVHYPGG